MSADIRSSPLAGAWYPAKPAALHNALEQYLANVTPASNQIPTPESPPQGLLVPHAGLRYSGPVAAHGFSAVRGAAFDLVVILGPLHYNLPGLPPNAGLLTSAHEAYSTPFGEVNIDREAVTAVSRILPLTPVRDDPEHSIEIELPFLQHVLAPGFRMLPIMLRDQSAETSARLAETLAETLQGRSVLFVASSDLSHFYPQATANELDQKMLGCVAAMDAQHVIEYDDAGMAFACGRGAIAAVIQVTQLLQRHNAQVVRYATSGDVTGDYARVVGYGAARFG